MFKVSLTEEEIIKLYSNRLIEELEKQLKKENKIGKLGI